MCSGMDACYSSVNKPSWAVVPIAVYINLMSTCHPLEHCLMQLPKKCIIADLTHFKQRVSMVWIEQTVLTSFPGTVKQDCDNTLISMQVYRSGVFLGYIPRSDFHFCVKFCTVGRKKITGEGSTASPGVANRRVTTRQHCAVIFRAYGLIP